MKNQRALVKVLTTALLACSGGLAVAAPDTQTLAVSATIIGTCKFSPGGSTLAFGTIDQSSTSDLVVPASVKYKCTKNTSSLGITGITGPLTMLSGSDTLAFSLAIAGDTSAGLGLATGAATDLTATVTGTIAAADFQAAPAGAYTKNVTLTITP